MGILDDEENYFAGRSGSGAFLGSDEDVFTSSLFAGLDLNALGIDSNLFAEGLDLNALLPDIIGDADVMNALKAQDPAAYAALLSAGELSGFTPVGSDNVTGQELVGPNPADSGDTSVNAAETKKLGRQAGTDPEQDPSLRATGVPVGDPNDPMGTKKLASISGDKTTSTTTDKKGILGTDITATDAAKYAAMLVMAKLAYDDAQRAREEARGWSAPGGYSKRAVRSPGGGVSFKKAASGGIMSLQGGGATNPIDYTPSFSDVSGVGLGAGFADPKIQEVIDKLNLRTAGGKNPELDILSNQISQQEDAIKNRFLADNVSIDQITGDIDPIQTLRNVRAYDPSTFDATVDSFSDVPGRINTESLGNLKTGIKDLQNLGVPYDDLTDVAQSIAEIRSNPELVGNLSNLAGDIRSVTKPTDEEELGSNYSGLMALLAPKMGEDVTQMRAAGGGIGSLDMARGGRTLPPRYLNGHSDGMADKVPANIDGKRPAALSDGEFVIPADVVSHLGNGNSNAGAKRLYKMMDDIRAARTGNPKQGKQINPDKFMPR
jgi:hypothetical protein